MTWREISVSQLNSLKQPLIVDVRSPCEHLSERICDSVNIPLLSDAERAEVGTIYAEQGELIARRYALRIIAPKIPQIVDLIANLRKKGQSVVVHCWRGGLRSEAVSSMLSIVGIDSFRLTGGYKSWRKQVLADLQRDDYQFVPIVLHGLTGAGKTDILRQLQLSGQSVLDLEAMASHRGSLFGAMGLAAQPTQKNFDAIVWQALSRFKNEPVFLEAESRKIGKLDLPDSILKIIRNSRRVLVTGSLEARARRIIDDYTRVLDDASKVAAIDSIMCLKERLGLKLVQDIQEMFRANQLKEAVEVLLAAYYDPLYKKQIERAAPFECTVSGDDPEAASKIIAKL